MKVILIALFILIVRSTFSQNEFQIIDSEKMRKIEFDNQSKIADQKTLIYNAYIFDCEKEFDNQTLVSLKDEFLKLGIINIYFDHKTYKYYIMCSSNINIENIKNILYKNSINFIDYLTTYAIKK